MASKTKKAPAKVTKKTSGKVVKKVATKALAKVVKKAPAKKAVDAVRTVLAPSMLRPAFEAMLQQEKLAVLALRPASVLSLLTTFYRTTAFSGRPQGTIADMLLYQHASGDGVMDVGFVRQLYSRGRGTQLTIDFQYAAMEGEWEPVTSWSSKFESIEAWGEAVRGSLGHLASVFQKDPLSVQVRIDQF